MKLFVERNKCPICCSESQMKILELDWNNPEITALFNKRGYPNDKIDEAAYVLMECKQCGLIFQKFSPNEEFSKELYNTWIASRKNANIDNYSFNLNNNGINIQSLEGVQGSEQFDNPEEIRNEYNDKIRILEAMEDRLKDIENFFYLY